MAWYKYFSNNDFSHNVYTVNKQKIYQCDNGQWDKQIKISVNPSIYEKSAINRFIQNNYSFAYKNPQNDNLISVQKDIQFPFKFFTINKNRISLQKNIVECAFYFGISAKTSYNIVRSIGIKQDNVYRQLDINHNIISYHEDIIGFYINQLGIIIWDRYYDNLVNIVLSYSFNIHQYEYYCSLLPGQFNSTRNITAYNEDKTLKQGIDTTFISSIGLYDNNNNLLAIAKLSSPIRKSNITTTTVIIQLDYIE